jgi:branched-chain amino acid transport system permease protein
MSNKLNKGLLALLIIASLATPIVVKGVSNYYVFILGITLLFMLWASGMHLTYGFTGMLPLMYGGLAGVGAYTSANLVIKAGFSFWLALPISGLSAALVGVLLGMPSLRLRGFYFALSTLVIQVAMTLLFTEMEPITGGDTGISNIPYPRIPTFSGDPIIVRDISYVYLILFFLFITIYLIHRIMSSNLGMKFKSIRDDDILAETLGINVTFYKLVSFFISSFIAGIGGSLYVHYVSFVSPRVFDVLASLTIWLMVVFGGRGFLAGPLIGAFVLTPMPYLLRVIYAYRDIIYGTIVVFTALVLPRGIYGTIYQRLKLKHSTRSTTSTFLSIEEKPSKSQAQAE